ncbi:hypothetical protein SOCEGT47_003190 [Sorangium cellulosum]|uniref:Uncharacterized protein n=1 Tax=Sorangium cellulosum TaxID=56 RepID=A0A4P2PU03_SORCE|nr:hypothetical protein [Sorangium cellulosum]AUX19866.1 hypothetical protein SOCEGT47_003190 [Sorangium cellulosum]
MTELLLTGLDGKNPLAFLSALGVLNALADRAKEGQPEPRLLWRAGGTYRPAIVGGPDRNALLDALVHDLESFRGEPAIERLRYRKDGNGAEAHDLKPPPGFFADYLSGLVREDRRRSLDFAAAFATDVAVDNNGNTKPTALHFTAGQQEFLGMVSELTQGVRVEDLEEALFGPWRYERPLPVLQWDNTSARDYALRASDPSKDKKLGVPGADWLAFRGLPFIRVAPVGDRIVTTGCSGEWKTGTFRWPIWTVPLPRSVIGSVLTSPELVEVDPSVLRARGIAIVLESAIRRSDQGGYGSFAPARMARPARGD